MDIEDMSGGDWFWEHPREHEIEYIFTKSIKLPDWGHDGYYSRFTLEWKLDGDETIRAYQESYDIDEERSTFDVYGPWPRYVTVCDARSLVELVNYVLQKEAKKNE